MNKQYLLACKNPSLREDFIKLVTEKFPLNPYARKITYKDKDGGLTVICTKIPFLYPLIKKKPAIIVVYPLAFDLTFHPQAEDFISTLIYHEGHHAKEIYLGIRKMIPAMDIEGELEETCENEIKAIKNQIRNFSGNSEKFIERVKRNLSSWENLKL